MDSALSLVSNLSLQNTIDLFLRKPFLLDPSQVKFDQVFFRFVFFTVCTWPIQTLQVLVCSETARSATVSWLSIAKPKGSGYTASLSMPWLRHKRAKTTHGQGTSLASDLYGRTLSPNQ
jgi:hypothetical protein